MPKAFFRPLLLAALAGVLFSAPAAHAAPGHDFVKDARLFHRVVACAPGTKAPPGFDAALLAEHCELLRARKGEFQRFHVEPATRFLDRWRPRGLPKKVVYPFGGGDLLSALLTFPDAREITTISLEHAGDPRRLARLRGDRDALAANLALFRSVGGELLRWRDSASKNLRKMERGPVPGQLSLFMLALSVLDYEPVSLRFFRIEPDGSLHYFSKAEIARLDTTLAGKKEARWIDTDYSVAFSNAELHLRKRGDPDGAIIVHRHIAANLANNHFAESALRKHLEAKGQVSAMTKAASYLLWHKQFKEIRTYLLTHMAWMISDATGILPRHSWEHGFRVITFGGFEGPFLEWAVGKGSEEMIKLWAANPQRKLKFRYGYPDAKGNYHLMITRKRPTAQSRSAPKQARPSKSAAPRRSKAPRAKR